ncbi:hypothetical protein EMPG_16180 [Blastomyces silverae]|uniref:Uncharacterized protein n=1 Tax=Blastomyces silverae TaxID=2060906 RepID=A0A0H1BAM3_9EURO|nr:hypothetical protein EMPG_16180 [Blastomyces silverae]
MKCDQWAPSAKRAAEPPIPHPRKLQRRRQKRQRKSLISTVQPSDDRQLPNDFPSPYRLKERQQQQQLFPSPPLSAIMAALNKIAANSPSRQNPSELETSLAGALSDLETNTPDLKAALRPLQFVSAREVRN